jgi:hypothetical protein
MFMPQQRIKLMIRRAASMMNWNVFNKFLKYHMKILLGNFNAKVGRKDIFKPTIGNENLQYATLTVKSMIYPHRNIHKYTWMSPDGKTHNQMTIF